MANVLFQNPQKFLSAMLLVSFHTWKPEENCWHFAPNIFKYFFLNQKKPVVFWLKFHGSLIWKTIHQYWSSEIQWHKSGVQKLPEPVTIKFTDTYWWVSAKKKIFFLLMHWSYVILALTHRYICNPVYQWVKPSMFKLSFSESLRACKILIQEPSDLKEKKMYEILLIHILMKENVARSP